jgi:hypothetical protein
MRASPAALWALLLAVGPLGLAAVTVVAELLAQEVAKVGLHTQKTCTF